MKAINMIEVDSNYDLTFKLDHQKIQSKFPFLYVQSSGEDNPLRPLPELK